MSALDPPASGASAAAAYRDAGVFYICYGPDFFYDETWQSIRSLRRLMPEMRIAVCCERPERLAGADVELLPLDRGSDPQLAEAPFFLKPLNLLRSPYPRTLYLDGDTFAVEPFWEVFDVLERFDVAGCIEGSLQTRAVASDSGGGSLGISFPEWNLGVLAVRQGPALAGLVRRWLEDYARLYREPARGGILFWNDQIPFRLAAWNSDARLLSLPNNYNLKIGPFDVACVNRGIKILHGRHADMAGVAAEINQHLGRRVICRARQLRILRVREDGVVLEDRAEVDAASQRL